MLALLIGLIAVSGLVLQAIMAVYGDTGPMQAPGEPFWAVQLRDVAVTLHTGAFTGMSGVWCSVLCGLGLLFFAGSGLWMYLDLHLVRVKQGRGGVFWRTRVGKGAAMRSLHRWITLPIVMFAILLAVTGISLDLYFAWFDMVPLPPPRGIHYQPVAGEPPPAGGHLWHEVSLSLHKLNFLGQAGHVLGMLLGAALLVMVASGLWIYLVTYRQRRKMGMTGLFW